MNLRDMIIMQITGKHLTDSTIYKVVDTEQGKHKTKYPVLTYNNIPKVIPQVRHPVFT